MQEPRPLALIPIDGPLFPIYRWLRIPHGMFCFGLGVGHQNSKISGLTLTIRKASRPDPALVSIISDVFDWEGSNLAMQITADDLDDFLEALEESDDGDAEDSSKHSHLLRVLNNL